MPRKVSATLAELSSETAPAVVIRTRLSTVLAPRMSLLASVRVALHSSVGAKAVPTMCDVSLLISEPLLPRALDMAAGAECRAVV